MCEVFTNINVPILTFRPNIEEFRMNQYCEMKKRKTLIDTNRQNGQGVTYSNCYPLTSRR